MVPHTGATAPASSAPPEPNTTDGGDPGSPDSTEREQRAMERFAAAVLSPFLFRAAAMAEANKGPPPASDKSRRRLPTVIVIAEDLADESNRQCSICFEDNNIGDKVTRLPCGHLYHRPCVLRWLESRCTCPVCRYELPTADAEYEAGRIERMKKRKPRLRVEELNLMSARQLRQLAFERLQLDGHDDPLVERSDVIDWIVQSGKVEIVEHPNLVEYRLSELKAMRVGRLRQAMCSAGVFFEARDVVEKEDMVQLFVQSGRVLILPEPTSSQEEVKEERNETEGPVLISAAKEKVVNIERGDEEDTGFYNGFFRRAFAACLN